MKVTVKTYTETDTMDFGKYKGTKVLDVAKDNPSYLMWADENVASFKLTDEFRTIVKHDAAILKEQARIRLSYLRSWGPEEAHWD